MIKFLKCSIPVIILMFSSLSAFSKSCLERESELKNWFAETYTNQMDPLAKQSLDFSSLDEGEEQSMSNFISRCRQDYSQFSDPKGHILLPQHRWAFEQSIVEVSRKKLREFNRNAELQRSISIAGNFRRTESFGVNVAEGILRVDRNTEAYRIREQIKEQGYEWDFYGPQNRLRELPRSTWGGFLSEHDLEDFELDRFRGIYFGPRVSKAMIEGNSSILINSVYGICSDSAQHMTSFVFEDGKKQTIKLKDIIAMILPDSCQQGEKVKAQHTALLTPEQKTQFDQYLTQIKDHFESQIASTGGAAPATPGSGLLE